MGYCLVRVLTVVCLVAPAVAVAQDSSRRAAEIIEAANFTGGVIVHLDCNDGALTASLGTDARALVQGLDVAADDVAAARARIASEGLYGRVSARQFDGARLPYIDNLINLIVSESETNVSQQEILRVLRPLGKAYLAGKVVTKPWPDEIDEWTHYLHGPDNNAVARDKVVGAPRGMQWVAGPKWGRSHEEMASMSAMVSAQGRLFSIVDESPLASVRFNSNWKLVARDGFDGTLLWKKDIPVWNDHLRHFRSGPVHLPRRLVAVGERVYSTLGLGGPLVELDAATGKTLQTFADTEHTEEIIAAEGILYLVVGSSEIYRSGGGLFERNEPQATDFRYIAALDRESGKQLWKVSFSKADYLLPMTLAVRGERLCYQDTHGMGCLDANTGKVLWRTKRNTPGRRMGYSAPTLVMTDKVVLCADREIAKGTEVSKGRVVWGVNGWGEHGFARSAANTLRAYSLDDGQELWSAPGREGYNAPVDIFVIKDVVYVGTKYIGYDLMTGEVVQEVSTQADPVSMPHPRCHRFKATEDLIITGRSGVEIIDLEEGGWVGNNSWLRGTCQYGVMPSNGLIYVPPDACACNPTVKVPGFFAAAPQRGASAAVALPEQPVLVQGPAFGSTRGTDAALRADSDWPMYRHDPQRSGAGKATVSAAPKTRWNTTIGGKLTQPVIAGKTVVVASVDAHAVHALSVNSGDELWRFTAGGRIDSAPTIFSGMVLFGSADGWVYALRADDGRLVWKFRAAPGDEMVGAYGQLESRWPVHGSVLVQQESLYASAGRSSYHDGGIVFYRLDPWTGAERARELLYHLDPETGRELHSEKRGSFDMVGTNSDILSGDGTNLYMKHFALDAYCKPNESSAPHLYSVTGLLDDEWFVRAYWRYGAQHGAGWGRWAQAASQTPFGRILSFNADNIYGYGRVAVAGGAAGHRNDTYHLFASAKPAANPSATGEKATGKGKQKRSGGTTPKIWSETSGLTIRALALASDRLLIAGPIDAGKKSAKGPLNYENDAETRAALRGERGSFLHVVSAKDGSRHSETPLASAPVFDGMSAAGDRVFISLQNGSVVCLQ